MSEVGIRALKQNASAVVAEAAAGETVTITDRGRPVARLSAIPKSRLLALIEEGHARPARSRLVDLPAERAEISSAPFCESPPIYGIAPRRKTLTSPDCQGTMTVMNLIATELLPAEPLHALREVARSEAELDELRWEQIAAARDAGASWAQVGEALGVSRQSAWEYFTRRASKALATNVASNTDLSEDEAMNLSVEEVRAVRSGRRAP